MPVYIEPSKVIILKAGLENGGEVHKFFTNTCYKYMDRYVPYSGDNKQGTHMRENVAMKPDEIIYLKPYSHAQYVGFTTGPVVNYTTAGTGPYWDRQMATANGDDVVREVGEYVKLRFGGK